MSCGKATYPKPHRRLSVLKGALDESESGLDLRVAGRGLDSARFGVSRTGAEPRQSRDSESRKSHREDPSPVGTGDLWDIGMSEGRTTKPLDETAAVNRAAWDKQTERGNEWTLAVAPETVARARDGELELVLTPRRSVPSAWLGDLRDKDVLGLAAAGGQQCPLMAAAGARVVSLDNAPRQLERDRAVATREGLSLAVELGDMRDLSRFARESFDLIFHPVSNLFVPDVEPVWTEAFRVLRPGGFLLAGMANPFLFCFEPEELASGRLELRYPMPYSDLVHRSPERREQMEDSGEPLAFGHSLEALVGGQLEAGFHLVGFYEDEIAEGSEDAALRPFLKGYMATRAVKPPTH